MSSSELKAAIAKYGRRLVAPPSSAYLNVDAIRIGGSTPPKWSIRFDLWTEEEGLSDLSLEATLSEHADHADLEVSIDNIHVL
jgi:hypothetical protein